jgi:hypothetical protein
VVVLTRRTLLTGSLCALAAFARALGDQITRLHRSEPEHHLGLHRG